MRSIGVIVTLLIFFLFSLTIASAAGDVAYIYRKNFKVDDNIVQAFNNLGLSVDLINEKNLPINFGQYKLLFVGDENFVRENQIPVNAYPSIVANYYHAEDWGITDAEGVSQLASSHPLSVVKDGRMIQVYTQAREYLGGPAIPYYFLDLENRAPGLQTVASTETTSSGQKFGDVISYASPGAQLFNGKTQNAKLCFYGIIESEYWTNSAKNLFNDCIDFVASECSIDSDCPSPEYSQPFCQNGDTYRTVTSYTCSHNGLAKCVANETLELEEECSYDCKNGSCVGECNTNEECGTSGSIGNLFCSAEINLTQTFQIYTCNNAGTSNSFCSSEIINQTIEQCSDICINGACEDIACYNDQGCNDGNSTTQDICRNAGTIDSYCENLPIKCFNNLGCGADGFVGGTSCSDLNVTRKFVTNICQNPGLATSFCTVEQQDLIVEQCSDACVSGACQDITCHDNSECNDLNPLTLDECINPNTIVSECRNTPINCAVDADCGFTGFLGEEICSSSTTISKNFQTAVCQNPGETNSRCKLTVEQRTIGNCDFACSGGSCVRCDENFDCDDSNSNTADLCNNPGTASSFCTNPSQGGSIRCTTDFECGGTIPLSQLFCSDKNINQLFQKWTCNNPGETISYCSSGLQINTNAVCDNFCSGGQCVDIKCFTNDNCDDSNSTTLDICNEPGTPASFCTHSTPEISCSSDETCGTDGFVGDSVCLNGDLTQLYQSFTCFNPGTTSSMCSTTASQLVIEECEYGCVAGQCLPKQGECTPGEIRTCGTNVGECSTGINVCFIDASWSSECFGSISPKTEICDNLDNDCDGQVDEGDVCGSSCSDECSTSGQKQCYNDGYRTCGNFDSDSCLEWSDTTSCSPGEICEAGSCVPEQTCSDVCTEGERQCSDNGYKTCHDYNGDGCTEWNTPTLCSFGQVCILGICVTDTPSCENQCTDGSRRCSGNGYQTCHDYNGDDCTEWNTPTLCSFGKVCISGTCQ